MAISIARGMLRLGLMASLPVWAIASKPIKLENNIAAADKKVVQSNSGYGESM